MTQPMAARRVPRPRLLAWWEVPGAETCLAAERTPVPRMVAEIMLQQTQVGTVVPYFERFTTRFPDVETLARAALDDVLHLWSGLGYYARARNLHRAAGIVVRDRGGTFPDTEAELEALPGVGRSTAAAIVAQAWGRRAPILDGNVKRVLARRHRVAGPVSSSATLGELWRLAESHTPRDRAADYTQAIMDLGATVCRRRRPRCTNCPVRAGCRAFAAGDPDGIRKPAARPALGGAGFSCSWTRRPCLVERDRPPALWGGCRRRTATAAWTDSSISRVVQAVASRPRTLPHAFHPLRPRLGVLVRLKSRPAAVREDAARWIDPADHRLGLSTVAARLVGATGG